MNKNDKNRHFVLLIIDISKHGAKEMCHFKMAGPGFVNNVTKIQMIIDCTKFRNSRFELNDIAEQQMEQNSRIMCYALHCIRSRSITCHRRKSDKRK
jgi:hypothetical protein